MKCSLRASSRLVARPGRIGASHRRPIGNRRDLPAEQTRWADSLGRPGKYQPRRRSHRIFGRKGEVARPGLAIRADARDCASVRGDCARCRYDRVALLCDDVRARDRSPANRIAKPAPCSNIERIWGIVMERRRRVARNVRRSGKS